MTEPMILPTSDMFVRYLLGSIGHEDLLLDLINAHLIDYSWEPITTLSLQNPFNLKTFKRDKESILDIRAKAKDGRTFNVEMQNNAQVFYGARSMYYWARIYQGQLLTKKTYDELNPAICINILNFKAFKTIASAHTCFVAAEKNHPNHLLTDAFQIHFYELPKYQYQVPFANQQAVTEC